MDFMVLRNSFLLLTQDMIGNFAESEWPKYGIPVFYPFKRVGKLFRAIRRLWIFWGLPFESIWFSREWIAIAKKSDIVVVHMSRLTMRLPKFINSLNPNANVVAWYWNVVDPATSPRKVKGSCEFWSFDPGDCKKYGMKFNHQYYFKTLIRKNENIEYDVFFCGTDSGRGEKLVSLYNSLNELGLNALFKIVYPQYGGIPESLKSKSVDYNELLELNVKSKSILEIVRPGQIGATARLMESLFLQKKLITNNESVFDEPFYNERNIFILGKRRFSELKDFILSSYDHSVDYFIDEYDFSNWLKKIVESR